MISINLQKDKSGTWHMRAMDTVKNNEREILRRVNKLAAKVEEQLVELGFLTEAECEAALAETASEALP
jgi:hypothetical protein